MRKASIRRQAARTAKGRRLFDRVRPATRLLQLMVAGGLLAGFGILATGDVAGAQAGMVPGQAQSQPSQRGQSQGPASQASSAGSVIVLDEIVAKVNNEIITLSDFKKELQMLRAELSQQFTDPAVLEREVQKRQGELLRAMIENKLMVQKAEELGITANIDVDVAAALEAIRKENNIPDMEVFDQLLRQQGSSLDQHRARIKQQMIIRTLVEQFVYSKLTLLTPEIEAYYKQNLDKFTEPAEVELAEILFLTEGKDKAQVRRKAGEVLARLKNGASFEEEAKRNSEGPTASRGGNIGVFKKGSMASALEAVVFDMKPGEVSDVIETDYGFQIVKLINKKDNQVKPLAEVRPIIQNVLYQQKAAPELKEFLDDLRSQSYIYVAPDYKKDYDESEQQSQAAR
ncbi:MAG TPA: peptidylprolyl isomerase [Acidobacteriota bacterium]|nr:peptidylprolyl isomerase [Acidobacteriota bacterium]